MQIRYTVGSRYYCERKYTPFHFCILLQSHHLIILFALKGAIEQNRRPTSSMWSVGNHREYMLKDHDVILLIKSLCCLWMALNVQQYTMKDIQPWNQNDLLVQIVTFHLTTSFQSPSIKDQGLLVKNQH